MKRTNRKRRTNRKSGFKILHKIMEYNEGENENYIEISEKLKKEIENKIKYGYIVTIYENKPYAICIPEPGSWGVIGYDTIFNDTNIKPLKSEYDTIEKVTIYDDPSNEDIINNFINVDGGVNRNIMIEAYDMTKNKYLEKLMDLVNTSGIDETEVIYLENDINEIKDEITEPFYDFTDEYNKIKNMVEEKEREEERKKEREDDEKIKNNIKEFYNDGISKHILYHARHYNKPDEDDKKIYPPEYIDKWIEKEKEMSRSSSGEENLYLH